jgi:FeS assembly SUF system regulator
MLRVTRLTDYATVVLTALAAQPDRVHPTAELAERARLEVTTVARVLKPLTQAGLVASTRGAAGGYKLARPAAGISLIAIVEAMEGPLEMTECSGSHSTCEHEPHCGVSPHWRRINDVIATALGGVTLADLLPPKAARKAIPLQLATARN